jgi:hypothetical protein
MEYSVLGHAVTQRSQSKAEEILKDILTGTGLRGNQKHHKMSAIRKEIFGKTVTGLCFTMQYC